MQPRFWTDSSASASQMLGLQVCTVVPVRSSKFLFKFFLSFIFDLPYVNNTKEFHCDHSRHVNSVP
jgi:hypothetical protein